MTNNEASVVILEVLEERAAQDKKWGGTEHDDQHSDHDWICFILEHAQRGELTTDTVFRKQMIRVAALAVAAVQAVDRRARQ